MFQVDRKTITFRHSLHSEVIDTLKHAGIVCLETADVLVSVISLLANYQEEGHSLSPDVFVCNSIRDLVQRVGTAEFVFLGKAPLNGGAAQRALKEAAPLATGNWAIFLERGSQSELHYGLFTGSTDPSALTLVETALETPDPAFPVLMARQLGPNRVEIRSNASRSRCFHFHGEEGSAHQGDEELASLAACIASGVSEELMSVFPGMMKRVLAEAIQKSHGTLIAVVPSSATAIPNVLHDMVVLNPIIDFAGRLLRHREDALSGASLSSLQAAAHLIQGMISSDGITVFKQGGHVLGFRAFVQSKPAAAGVVGGARTRAFQALSEHVGGEFSAAFFRSQDGVTKLKLSDAEPKA